MKNLSSRFYGSPSYRRPAVTAGGRTEIELMAPRFGQAGQTAVLHRVAPGDRLDLLAVRYYGDPLQAWRIADANPTLDPLALLVPGQTLAVPRAG